MAKSPLNRSKEPLLGWEAASPPPHPSPPDAALPRVYLAFTSLKRADTARTLLWRSNREPLWCGADNRGGLERATPNTHIHTFDRRLRRWIFSWKHLGASDTAEACRLSRASGCRDVAGRGGWGGAQLVWALWSATFFSFALRTQDRKGKGTGRGERQGRGGIEPYGFIIPLCVSAVFLCVSEKTLTQMDNFLSHFLTKTSFYVVKHNQGFTMFFLKASLCWKMFFFC